jgi:uncharacterized protein (TIGR02246 family)
MTMTANSTIEDQSAVRHVLRNLVDAWGDNDADAFAALYTEDASVVLSGGPYLSGRDEIRTYMAAGFAGPLKGSTSMDRQESIRFLGADIAVVVSLSGFALPGEDGVPADRMRRATWVLSRRNGDWLAEAYHNCLSGS